MKLVTYTIIVALGFLIGTTTGEILRLVLPEKFLAVSLFKNQLTFGFSDLCLDAKIVSFKFSIKILVTVFSWIGMFFSAVVLLAKEIFTG